MTTPLPPLPWQVTGNHWIALPCVHPVDASVHAVGMLHRGTRSAIEFAGSADFLSAGGPPLVRPVVEVGGVVHRLGATQIVWERTASWIPTFTATVGALVVRGTIFAPFGRDADVAGFVYALSVENRGTSTERVALMLQGKLGHRQQRVRTPRGFTDRHHAAVAGGTVLLEGDDPTSPIALAVRGDADTAAEVSEPASAAFALRCELSLEPGAREAGGFYIAAAAERDGAHATVATMVRRGWRDLLAATRTALTALEQTTGNDATDGLVNRNLLFAYFYSVGRALDDAQHYLVRTRAPWNDYGVTVRDWEALSWTLPAVQLADPRLARELILRACELHGYAPGSGVHYLDGTLFQPGFSLEGAAAYPIAADRYIRETGDDQIVEEPVLGDTLYAVADDLADRRDAHVPLYSTDVTPSGVPPGLPYTLHGNAVVAMAFDALKRTLDAASAAEIEDPAAVRAAVRRHFQTERGSQQHFMSAIDLAGKSSPTDDASGSILWLPIHEAVERTDSTFRRTARRLDSNPTALALRCARLMGADASEALLWLRRAPLDNGLAAELVDATGAATGNGGDASLAGLLAWSTWYAVHALGTRV